MYNHIVQRTHKASCAPRVRGGLRRGHPQRRAAGSASARGGRADYTSVCTYVRSYVRTYAPTHLGTFCVGVKGGASAPIKCAH